MLDSHDKEWIDAVFVRKDDCTETQAQIAEKLAYADTRIRLNEQRMKQWDKLLWVIASTTLGQLVTTILGMLGGVN